MRRVTYVVLLRGVNVGGGTRVPMAELREMVEDLGHEAVQTYVQSGNVVLRSAEKAAAVAAGVASAVAERLGLDVAVMARTASEIAAVASRNPFAGRASDPKALYVTFLAGAPASAAVAGLDPARYEPDEYAVEGREVFLHMRGGYGRTKLSNAELERRLGIPATTRNWRTVTTLAQLAAR